MQRMENQIIYKKELKNKIRKRKYQEINELNKDECLPEKKRIKLDFLYKNFKEMNINNNEIKDKNGNIKDIDIEMNNEKKIFDIENNNKKKKKRSVRLHNSYANFINENELKNMKFKSVEELKLYINKQYLNKTILISKN